MLRKSQKKFELTFGTTPEEAAYYKSQVQIRQSNDLNKSILNVLNGPNFEIERLAFETDPSQPNTMAGIYKQKMRLLPDVVLKRIAIQDSLVSNIVRARQNHLSAFGRPRPDRFSTGFIIRPNAGVTTGMSDKEKQELGEEIDKAVRLLSTCGHTEGVADHHQKTFSEYLSLSARDAVVVGRIATEIVYKTKLDTKEKEFHYFVNTDAGTIYQAAPDDAQAKQNIRDEAFDKLKELTGNKDLVREKWNPNNEYRWVQVINGQVHQVFTNEEMKCCNFYPASNVELDGYPVTPIDTVISAITTHLNITTHNKVYFQSGRATRGMLVIKSDDINSTILHNLKQQFNANINSVGNSFRMPVLGFNSDADVEWKPIDTSGNRDMEFQYLTDLNAREILTAFMMSPDELPGWSYLSRGTNSQALSESSNEFRLEAARDVGIRPLVASFEEFINAELFPLISPKLAKICRVVLAGLDSDSPEKEIVNIQQNAQVHMTYNDILEKVEKKPIPKKWASEIPLNPTYKGYVDQLFTVGEILEYFCGVEGAAKNPKYDYIRDPFYFQNMQLKQADAQLQAQQQQMQAAQQQQISQQSADQSPNNGPEDLGRAIDQAYDIMSKSEAQLSPEKRKVLMNQNRLVDWLKKGFEDDSKDTIDAILDVAKHFKAK